MCKFTFVVRRAEEVKSGWTSCLHQPGYSPATQVKQLDAKNSNAATAMALLMYLCKLTHWDLTDSLNWAVRVLACACKNSSRSITIKTKSKRQLGMVFKREHLKEEAVHETEMFSFKKRFTKKWAHAPKSTHAHKNVNTKRSEGSSAGEGWGGRGARRWPCRATHRCEQRTVSREHRRAWIQNETFFCPSTKNEVGERSNNDANDFLASIKFKA